MHVTVNAREQKTRRLSAQRLEQAVDAFRRDGYVVIENAVPHEPLDLLRQKMDEDAHLMIAREMWKGDGRQQGHLQQAPPPFAPFVFPDIVANPFAIQVNTALLGPGIYNALYTANTNCPGSIKQPLHRDGNLLWPGHDFAHPTSAIVVNICTLDVAEENGAVELWPGTQLHPFPKKLIGRGLERTQRQVAPPVRGCTAKGSLLLRDVRLWHRGVPNRSDQIRHMIAQVHYVHWLRKQNTPRFVRGCESAFPADCGLDHNVEFTDERIDYLGL